jgi:putative Holliday junction resolvase
MAGNGGSRVPGRVLGLDLGDARIGVSISDPDRRLALPLGTVQVGRPPGELRAIADLVREHGVVRVVVGHPLSLDGSAGPRAHKTTELATALGALMAVPVELHDERFSTVEAERVLRDAGARGRRVRGAVDRTAATVILQSWLDAHSSPGA